MSRSKQVDRPDRRCASGRVVAEEEVELRNLGTSNPVEHRGALSVTGAGQLGMLRWIEGEHLLWMGPLMQP